MTKPPLQHVIISTHCPVNSQPTTPLVVAQGKIIVNLGFSLVIEVVQKWKMPEVGNAAVREDFSILEVGNAASGGVQR